MSYLPGWLTWPSAMKKGFLKIFQHDHNQRIIQNLAIRLAPEFA